MILEDLKILDCFNLDETQKQQFLDFFNLLITENKKYNLTAITDVEGVLDKHFFDSLSISLNYNFSNLNVLDIGTGGGFPGIPLAIKFKEANFYLLEASKKKCDFIKMVIEKLDLKNVTVLNKRCEDLEITYREFFDAVVTRAVSELRIISELAIPFLKIGGHFLPYKGINYIEEIENAKATLTTLKSELIKKSEYELPYSKQNRYILDIIKTGKTDKIYPRNYNLIKSKPIKIK